METQSVQSLVCLDENEFERLKRNEIKYFKMLELNKNSLLEINNEVDSEITYKLNRIEKRQSEQEKYSYELNGEIKRSQLELQKNIDTQNKILFSIRQEYVNSLKNEKENYLKIFFEQSNAIFSQINKINQSSLPQIYIDKIDNLYEINQKKKEKIQAFISDIKIILESLDNLPHTKFFPGKYEYAKSLVTESTEDFKSGFYEASMISLRNCYKILVNLKNDVLKKEQEQIYFQSILNKNIKYIIKVIEINQKKDISIFNQTFTIDTDSFINLSVSKIKKHVNIVEKKISENYDFSANEVAEIIKQIQASISYLKSEFESILEIVLASQLSYNIAKILSDKLNLLFFSLKTSTYISNDYKKPYYLLMVNNLGKNVKFIIESDKKNKYDYKIKLESEIEYINQDFIRNIFKNSKIIVNKEKS